MNNGGGQEREGTLKIDQLLPREAEWVERQRATLRPDLASDDAYVLGNMVDSTASDTQIRWIGAGMLASPDELAELLANEPLRKGGDYASSKEVSETRIYAHHDYGPQSDDWERRFVRIVAPCAAPADKALLSRRVSELEPSAFGATADVAPIDGLALAIAREQVRMGLSKPFPAVQCGGWKVVWEMPDGTRLASFDNGKWDDSPDTGKRRWLSDNILLPVPEGAVADEYAAYQLARDAHEHDLDWVREHRKSSFTK